MRCFRFSLKKIIILCGLLVIVTFLGYPVLITKHEQDLQEHKTINIRSRRTVYREDGTLGNYEFHESSVAGPGENGAAHVLRPDQKGEEDRFKDIYGFNQLVSDEISLDRRTPDLRDPECQHWDYPNDLPTTSVIFIFHNEGWSTLLRSVHSVINRTPVKVLREVVLVDDKSELEHLHEDLEEEIKRPFYQGKVKLVRNKEREGLIRARNIGGIAASGEVLVFLDAHCEVGINWLPPLLAPIVENPKTLSVPVIDGINWNDFSINPVYQRGSHSRGIFEWGMLYKEINIPDKEKLKRSRHSEPYNSPTHAGGLFAIRRNWFEELGWYDPGLQIWGGENYELSFKLWQCGGRQVWVPCSHIGHVYRGHSCSSCHSGGAEKKWGGVPLALRNYKRLIETWFDPIYKEYFYTREPLARFIDMGDISEQVALKTKMNCKSFTWFMQEIAYDVVSKYPPPPPNTFWGEIRNKATNLCIDTLNRSPPQRIGTSGCHSFGGNQLWRLNSGGQLAAGEWCVEYRRSYDNENELIMEWCRAGQVTGDWKYDVNKETFLYTPSNLCLTINRRNLKLVLADCNIDSDFHKWTFKTITPHWARKKN